MAEMDKTREQWRRAFSPISSRELSRWLDDWKFELTTIPYLKLVKSSTAGLVNMVELRAHLNVDGLNLAMVRADLERVWGKDISKGLRASHCFRDSGNGLSMYFSALTGTNNYITGVVYVTRPE